MSWINLQLGCICKKQPRQRTSPGSKHWQNGPTVTRAALPHRRLTFASHRKSRLNAPQLQAQLSRLSDSTRLGQLKDTLHSKGAQQQVIKIENLMSLTSGSTTLTQVRAVHATRLYHQRTTVTRQQGLHGLWSVPLVRLTLGTQLETCTRSHQLPSNF